MKSSPVVLSPSNIDWSLFSDVDILSAVYSMLEHCTVSAPEHDSALSSSSLSSCAPIDSGDNGHFDYELEVSRWESEGGAIYA